MKKMQFYLVERILLMEGIKPRHILTYIIRLIDYFDIKRRKKILVVYNLIWCLHSRAICLLFIKHNILNIGKIDCQIYL